MISSRLQHKKLGQNLEKSPGDLRRLGVTQNLVRNHLLTLVRNILKGVNDNDNIYIYIYRERERDFCSPDGDTDYFDIVTCVLQEDSLAPHMFITCLHYVLRTSIDIMKDDGFTLAKERSRRYPAWTIMDADYTDDIALLANTPAEAETQPNSLEQAVCSIGFHDNADKTEYMCFNQRGDIFTLKGGPLKLEDKFISVGSSISTTEKDINTRLAMAWTAMDNLSVIWKLDLTNTMKRSFFQAAVVSILQYGCTTSTLT